MNSRRVRFFWIGEDTEVFAAESIYQIAFDQGECGSTIARHVIGVDQCGSERVKLFDLEGEDIEWGEIDANWRGTIHECDEDERLLGTLRGLLIDMPKFNASVDLPVQLLTDYT